MHSCQAFLLTTLTVLDVWNIEYKMFHKAVLALYHHPVLILSFYSATCSLGAWCPFKWVFLLFYLSHSLIQKYSSPKITISNFSFLFTLPVLLHLPEYSSSIGKVPMDIQHLFSLELLYFFLSITSSSCLCLPFNLNVFCMPRWVN